MDGPIAFLPELIFGAGALALFVLALGNANVAHARRLAVGVALAAVLSCIVALRSDALLFDGAYRVDFFSQFLKLLLAVGYLAVVLVSGELPDIRADVKPEYFLFVTLSVSGLVTLVSAAELITMVISLELVSVPLYALVAMRREGADRRAQMESAIKYIVFGVMATGLMLFGMSYLYGLTGTTNLGELVVRLQPKMHSTLGVIGLSLAMAGLFYKLAVFPFHFWTPDVYQGGSNETTGLIAALPKLGAMAVLVRFTALAGDQNQSLVLLLSSLAICSMFYGNLIALVQTDLKRLLGFSGIAHAGYALIGIVALGHEGYTAALYYVTSYMFMILTCFVVLCRTATEGENLRLEGLAGLHRRSPLLAGTLLVGVFGLAGVPPFAGFIGKFVLLKTALAKGHLALVVVTVINSAIAVYYYLLIIREAFFREPIAHGKIQLDLPTRLLCVGLAAMVVWLGVAPDWVLDKLSLGVKAALAFGM